MSTTVMPPPALETARGDLVLRVSGSTRDGQVLRLKSAKCTIGSGPRSTLRLRARGVQPTHCLIVRGCGGTLIRRWSPDTRLNGRAFTDAELVEGDRLGIGAIELEVLDPGRLSSAEQAASRQEPPQEALIPRADASHRSDGRRVDQLAARLSLANRQGRNRVRRLLEQLRLARQEVQQLEELQAEHPELDRQLSERTDAINVRSSDLEDQREALDRERGEWNSHRLEAEERFRQRSEELQAKQAQAEERLRQRSEELEAKQAEAEERLRQRSEELEAKQAEAEERLRRQREELEASRAEAEERLRRQREELEASRAEWEVQREDLQRCREQRKAEQAAIASRGEQEEPAADEEKSEADAQELPQPEPPETPCEEPLDIDDVFLQMGSGGPSPQKEKRRESTQAADPQPADVHPADQAAPQSPSEDEQGEETIEDYMSQLMDRVHTMRGEGKREEWSQEVPTPDESQRAEASFEPEVQRASEVTQVDAADTPRPVAPAEKPAEVSARAAVPEKPANLSAMRELANLSAHTAIDRHARRQARIATSGKLLTAVVGVTVGGVLLWMWWTMGAGQVAFFAAMASFLVALFWGMQCVQLANRKRLGESGPIEDRSQADGEGKKAGAPDPEQDAACGDRAEPASDDASPELEHELKALIGAWPKE